MMHLTKQFQHLKIQLEVIKSATNNFADDKCIGRGGFGKVYKGELLRSEGNIVVAIKRLDPRFGQGNPEFWKEIVILSLYKHENIISLLGFCDESNEKILVYEYASRKSLDLYLDNTDLSWIQRLKICIGVARGLAYLHNHGISQQRVLHRDIKSSNILLDENWNAKISDLGLSKFGPANQQYTFLVSNIVGTLGYCDPLYIETGLLTKESDVYSFGVVLFEVLCGRLCIINKKGIHESLVSLVRHYYPQNKISKIIYGNIRYEMNPESLRSFITISYQCLKKDLKERPLMSDVVSMLQRALKYQAQHSSFIQIWGDIRETVGNLPPPINIKLHISMCTNLMKPIENVLEIFQEIEEAGPLCDSGIKSLFRLNTALGKVKSLIQNCSESSKLYLALTGSVILSRCKEAKTLLEHSLSELQNMVPVMLPSKIPLIITELRRAEISLDPSDEEAEKKVKAILDGYKTENSSQNENVNECIRIVAIKLQLTSQKALLNERRSIKKLLGQLGEGGDHIKLKKHFLMILMDVLKKHADLMISAHVENTCELDVESSQELDDTLPWEFQCKFVEDLMARLEDDDRGCKFMSCENLFESIVRFLKVARNINDVKAQKIGCLLMLVLVTKCRRIKNLSNDAYALISELLESEVNQEALAIIEGLSSRENHRCKIASSGALNHIFNILDTQIIQFQTPALKILYNLTLNRNFRSLLSTELIPKLVTLSEDESLSSYCIAILRNLCGNQDNKSIIAETNGCIAFVANVLESESCEDQEHALEILVSLCSQSIEYCRLVMNEGVIPAIVCISINGNDKGKAKAHEMLRLLRDTEIDENVVEESPAQFKCPISLKNTCELDIELSQELDDTLPWEFQCKFIENLKIRLKDDHRACKLTPSENFLESIIRFLKAARNKNDIKPQRMGCLLLLGLVTKFRSIKNLSNDAYELISEFLELDLKEEAPAIIEN